MSGLVFELQQAAMDSTVKVADVLRKALVVTKKLSMLTPSGGPRAVAGPRYHPSAGNRHRAWRLVVDA